MKRYKVTLRKQRNGGRDYYYPADEPAKFCCQLVRRTTLTIEDMRNIQFFLSDYASVEFVILGEQERKLAI